MSKQDVRVEKDGNIIAIVKIWIEGPINTIFRRGLRVMGIVGLELISVDKEDIKSKVVRGQISVRASSGLRGLRGFIEQGLEPALKPQQRRQLIRRVQPQLWRIGPTQDAVNILRVIEEGITLEIPTSLQTEVVSRYVPEVWLLEAVAMADRWWWVPAVEVGASGRLA